MTTQEKLEKAEAEASDARERLATALIAHDDVLLRTDAEHELLRAKNRISGWQSKLADAERRIALLTAQLATEAADEARRVEHAAWQENDRQLQEWVLAMNEVERVACALGSAVNAAQALKLPVWNSLPVRPDGGNRPAFFNDLTHGIAIRIQQLTGLALVSTAALDWKDGPNLAQRAANEVDLIQVARPADIPRKDVRALPPPKGVSERLESVS